MKNLKGIVIFLCILIIVFGGFYFISQNINNNRTVVGELLPDNGFGQFLALIYLMSPIIFPTIIYFLWTSNSESKDNDYTSNTVTQIEPFKDLANVEKNKKSIIMFNSNEINSVLEKEGFTIDKLHKKSTDELTNIALAENVDFMFSKPMSSLEKDIKTKKIRLIEAVLKSRGID
jgi:hypothetical protein